MIHTCVTQFSLDSAAVDFRIDNRLVSLDYFTVSIPRCFLKNIPDIFTVRFSNFDEAMPIYNYLGNWLRVSELRKYLTGNNKKLICYRGVGRPGSQAHINVLTPTN